MNEWNFEKEIQCDCGKKYKLYKIKIIIRDKDSVKCECGRTLFSWNEAKLYKTELIEDNK